MQPGANVITLRGPESWRGMSSSTQADIGDRRWKLLQGVYVAPDGVELRKLPGWKCVYDFVGSASRDRDSLSMADGAQPGFLRTFIDGWNPVSETSDDYRLVVADPTYKQLCYAPAEYLHGFKRMKGRLVLWGEMGMRREPIKNNAESAFVWIASWETGTNKITFNEAISNNGTTRICTAVLAGGLFSRNIQSAGAGWTVNQWVGFAFTFENIDYRGTVVSNTADTLLVDFAGHSVPTNSPGPQDNEQFSVFSGDPDTGSDRRFNSLRGGSYLWIGDIPDTNLGAASLRNQVHRVLNVEGATATLATTITASEPSVDVEVECARVMPSRITAASYPLGERDANASWDKTSLGAWVSLDKADVDTLRTECFPINVFNRQRDYGDDPYVGREHIEGNSQTFEADDYSPQRPNVSRRHQKSLPFRTNPDVAADKILLGAPGYGCVFQIPMSATVNPHYGGTGTALGLTGLWSNAMFDKPRSLGVPKGVMWADYFRRSDLASAHFYDAVDHQYAWGGYRSFTLHKLASRTGTYSAPVFYGNGRIHNLDLSGEPFPANYFDFASSTPMTILEASGTVIRVAQAGASAGVEDYLETEDDGYWSGVAHVRSGDVSTGIVTINPSDSQDWATGSFTAEVTANAIGNYDIQKRAITVDREEGRIRFTFTDITLVADEWVGKFLRFVEPLDPSGPPGTGSYTYPDPTFRYYEILANGTDWIEFGLVDPVPTLRYRHYTIGGIAWPRASIGVEDDRYGTYKFKIAYRDTATGEVGLVSDELELEVVQNIGRVSVGTGIRLFVMHPGYLMAETGALQVELYRTKRNGNEFFFDSVVPMNQAGGTVTGTPATKVSSTFGFNAHPNHTGAVHFCVYDVPYQTDEELEERGAKYVPEIEQMPVGAVAVKTIKGITLFGGHIGNSGDALDLIYGTLSFGMSTPNTGFAYNDQLVVFGGGTDSDSTTGYHDGPWLCAQDYLPTAYAGIGGELFIPNGFPGNSRGVELGRVTHCSSEVAFASMKRQHIVMGQTPLLPDTTLSTQSQKPAWLKPKTAFYNWSVQGEPGVVPAVNVGFVDPDNDEDIQAIGAYAGGAVICTRGNTYFQNWIDEPRASPDLVTNEFGCLGTNTMVEYDGGTAWISDRGPVAMTAEGVTWIGRDLEAEFHGSSARYLKDSRGLMRHAFGCHDPERGLVYWGLYTEKEQSLTISYEGTTYTWDGSNSDQLKSRWPCNEILVWSYKARAFSRWRLPSSFGILWMESDIDVDGARRILFLGSDKRIYALDDLFSDTNKDPLVVAVSAAGTGTALTEANVGGSTWGIDQAALGATEKFLRLGMEVLLLRGGATPLYRGTVTAASASSLTVTWDTVNKGSAGSENPSWRVGDFLAIGVRRSVLETNWLSGTGTEKSQDVLAVQIRYLLESRFTREWALGQGGAQIEALKLSCYSSKSPNSIDNQTFTESVVTTDVNEIGNYRSLGSTTLDTLTSFQFQKVPLRAAGPHYKLRLEFVGGSNVRLADVLVEV